MKNDVVYFCKESATNEELIYSIRSVVANFPYRKIWVYGRCPANTNFDEMGTYVRLAQVGTTKWDKVKNMFRDACLNDDITENFWLFNDDFFVMNKMDNPPIAYRGSLPKHIVDMEIRFNNKPTAYTEQLRKAYVALKNNGFSYNSYELHIPFKFNRAKLLQTMGAFQDIHCTRTLYGNMFNIGGKHMSDVKVYGKKFEGVDLTTDYLSTDDVSWSSNTAGVADLIRSKFDKKSPYEK